MIREEVILLLTGTVDPKQVIKTVLIDPIIREHQYIEALNYYLKVTNYKIVFVENSNWSLAGKFQEVDSDRIEFLTYDGNKNSFKGKGIGEMEILEYFVANSVSLKSNSIVVKLTGRYKVMNIAKYINYYLELNNRIERASIMVDLKSKMKYSDSRFFVSDYRFLNEYLLTNKDLINDSEGYYFEHALAKACFDFMKDDNFVFKFPFSPIYNGVYATENKIYKNNIFKGFIKDLYYKMNNISNRYE